MKASKPACVNMWKYPLPAIVLAVLRTELRGVSFKIVEYHYFDYLGIKAKMSCLDILRSRVLLINWLLQKTKGKYKQILCQCPAVIFLLIVSFPWDCTDLLEIFHIFDCSNMIKCFQLKVCWNWLTQTLEESFKKYINFFYSFFFFCTLVLNFF